MRIEVVVARKDQTHLGQWERVAFQLFINEESDVLRLVHLMTNFPFVLLQQLNDERSRVVVIIRVLIVVKRYPGGGNFSQC